MSRTGSANITYPACTDQGDAHTRGQMLGRIWRDIHTNIMDPDDALLLFADWTMLTGGTAPPPATGCTTVDQPADTGTLIEVLTADDDDADISNGTPNDLVICAAFDDRDIETQFGISPCPAPLHGGGRADMNYDGALDFFDFMEFQGAFAAADPFADFTGDGVLDFFDFVAFESEFAAGCW